MYFYCYIKYWLYICSVKTKQIITIKTLKIMATTAKQMENQMGLDLRAKNEVFISCTILKETDKAINVLFIADCVDVDDRKCYNKKVYAWFPKSRTEVVSEHLIKTEGWLLVSKLIEGGVRPDDFDKSAWNDNGILKDVISADGN